MDGQKTVIMLGTGASYASDFKLPTMKGFFEEDRLKSRPELQIFLKWLYPNNTCKAYNLEEVLAHLDISKIRGSAWGTAPRDKRFDTAILYDEFIDYVQERLRIKKNAVCTLHEKVAHKLDSKDTIITMNYDLIMDNALLSKGTWIHRPASDDPSRHKDPRMDKLQIILGYARSFGGDLPTLYADLYDTGFYLKLHGSLDWLICPNESCLNSQRIFSCVVEESTDIKTQLPGRPCSICGSSLMTYIVPPVATKRIDVAGKLAFLWNLAFGELHKALRIVIAGLSFAPSDFELRWLVRESMRYESNRPAVDIVNPCKIARDSIKALMPEGCGIMTPYEDINSWLDSKPLSWD